jgi:hypothetical protein
MNLPYDNKIMAEKVRQKNRDRKCVGRKVTEKKSQKKKWGTKIVAAESRQYNCIIRTTTTAWLRYTYEIYGTSSLGYDL